MATNCPSDADIERAASIIRAGGLVAFPTETVYGLGANALDATAVARIYAAKQRPSTSPLIVHVASVEMARTVAAEWPDTAQVLAERFWPGPLTLVLQKEPIVPDQVTAGLPTVGVRMPAHPLALRLIRSAGVPIAAPSANRFTELSPTDAAHVRSGLGDKVDLVLDGGPTHVGIESTVLSLSGGRPVLLRPGMVTISQLEELVGPVGTIQDPISGPHSAPGLHRKHYSPTTRLVISNVLPAGNGAYLWWHKELPAPISVRMPDDPESYARELYAILHRLDATGLHYIAVEPVPEDEAWDGIRDRLRRASTTG